MNHRTKRRKADERRKHMTLAGWIFMLGSIGVVCGLVCFCYSIVLRNPNE